MIFYTDEKGTLFNGDVREVLKELPDNSVDCVVTSPPYWGLRDYGISGQLGNESTFSEYITKLSDIFYDLGRTLKDSGTMWINLGDTYYSKNKGAGGHSKKQDSNKGSWYKLNITGNELPEKSLSMIPARFAIEMQNRGFILRNDIIWAKPNPMPESVTDRLTKSHEHIFLFSKNKNYYFDNLAIAEPAVWTAKNSDGKRGNVSKDGDTGLAPQRHGNRMTGRTMDGHKGAYDSDGKLRANLKDGRPIRNKRDVWNITPKAFKGAHFATFPKEIPETCILAGCPDKICSKCGKPYIKYYERDEDYPTVDDSELDRFGNGNAGVHRKVGGQYQKWLNEHPLEFKGYKPDCNCDAKVSSGIVLDPFFGSGTTGLVAEKLNRNWIGIELNEKYCDMSINRILGERNGN